MRFLEASPAILTRTPAAVSLRILVALLATGTELPLTVLGRGTPLPRKARDGSDSATNRMSEAQFAAWDRIWRGFQQDLAKRSTRGEFRVAEKSGHFIPHDQPELIVQANRDVTRNP